MANGMRTAFAAARTVAFLLAGACLVQFTHPRASGVAKAVDEQVFVPDGKVLRHFVLGQQTSAADFYWLKLVQYLGEPAGDPSRKIHALANLITDLDPEYGYAYMAPSLVLGMRKRFDEANQLLEKGIRAGVERWELPFYLGFNRWYEQSDFEGAAKWLGIASRAPGRPPWLPILVTRLLSTAGDVNSAIDFVRAMAEQAPNDAVRDDYTKKIAQLVLERDVQQLEAAVEAFKAREGGIPWGFSELPPAVIAGLTNPIEQYRYDPVDGKVECPALERRFKIKRPGEVNVVATPRE